MGQIQISSPFLRNFTTVDNSVGTSISQVLTVADAGVKRIAVIVQNTHATANVEVMGNAIDTAGIIIYPKSTISFDNYNGGLWAKSTVASTSVHIAISAV